MGSGKTVVGRSLAERLGHDFVDTDDVVEKNEGRSIREIFERDGEAYFRECETAALNTLADRQGIVVATGGGILIGETPRTFILGHGLSIWLDTPLDTIWQRCREMPSRPLFSDLPQLAELLRAREEFYTQADHRVRVGDKSVAEVVDEICALL